MGSDLGPEPGPWEEWWEEKGAALRARHDEQVCAARSLRRFRAAVLEGRWEDAASLLADPARGLEGNEITGVLAERKRDLRRAYRDARVVDVELVGERATLTVDWGKSGFESRELELVRVGDQRRFASRPWSGRVVKQPQRRIQQTKPRRHIRLRPEGTDIFPIMFLCVLVPLLGATVLYLFRTGRRSGGGGYALVAVLAGLLAAGVFLIVRQARRPRGKG